MREYIIKRLLLMAPALLGVTFVVFAMVRAIPGDVVMAQLADAPLFDKAHVAELRHKLGLDRPFLVQYGLYMGNLFQGDMGKSLWSRKEVSQEIRKAFPITLELAILSSVIAIVLGVVLGTISALYQDTWADHLVRVVSISGMSIPNFWLGTLLILLPVLWFGYLAPIVYVPFFDNPLRNLQQFSVPAAALGFRLSALVMRMARSEMLEVLRQDYIRTAKAKGLAAYAIISRHALRNALIPVLTLMGIQFGQQLGGAVIIENIFVLPGIGRLALGAIVQRDYTVLQGTVLFLAVVFLVINLAVDLSYRWLDPRVRLS